jgi:predicted secreted Zn-dependent protease
MKHLSLSILCMILLLGCNGLNINPSTPSPTSTAVTAVEILYAKIIYYDISGSTEKELRDQMNALAPVGPDGYRGDALTTWYIHWTWDGYGTEDCDLRSLTVTYDIKVTMPRWNPPQDVSPALIEKWNTYMLALATHEKVHVDNVIANLPLVINAIRRATCSTAEARAQDVLSGIRLNDANFDATTNHGATQGAQFP